MSRVERLDLAALRARLIIAIEGCEGLEGSSFLLAIGACYISASPSSPFEGPLWASLFEQQAMEENVNGADILSTLASVTAVVS